MNTNAPSFNKEAAQRLSYVVSRLSTQEDVEAFLGDVLTAKEISEISARLEAARLLNDKQTYLKVVEATGLSSRTVARISSWLKDGSGGYDLALNALTHYKKHI